MLPDGWTHVVLGEISKIGTGGTPSRSNQNYWCGSIPWMSSGEVNNKYVDNTAECITELGFENSSASWFPKDSVMVALNGQGKTRGMAAILCSPMTCNQSLAGIVAEEEKLFPFYLLFLLEYNYTNLRNITGGEGRRGLNLGLLKSYEIALPSIEEQKKIARILGSVDAAVEATQNIIDQTERSKKALTQVLLIGKKRLAGFTAPWRSLKLGDVTTELKARNKDEAIGIDGVMGVNKVHGIIPMRRETIGSSLDRYKILPPKAYAYNPMRINIGSLAVSDKPDDVMVSPDYVVFKCNEGELDPDYLNHFRRTHPWDRFMEIAGNGSVRIRIYYKDLASMKLKLPEIDEQKKIVQVLNAVDDQILQNQNRLEQLQKLKTALMQVLLTGKVRVPLDNAEQEDQKEVVNA